MHKAGCPNVFRDEYKVTCDCRIETLTGRRQPPSDIIVSHLDVVSDEHEPIDAELVRTMVAHIERQIEEQFRTAVGVDKEDFYRRSFLVTDPDGRLHVVTPHPFLHLTTT